MKQRFLILLISFGILFACCKSNKNEKMSEERELVVADSVSKLIQIQIQSLSSQTDSLSKLINDLKK